MIRITGRMLLEYPQNQQAMQKIGEFEMFRMALGCIWPRLRPRHSKHPHEPLDSFAIDQPPFSAQFLSDHSGAIAGPFCVDLVDTFHEHEIERVLWHSSIVIAGPG